MQFQNPMLYLLFYYFKSFADTSEFGSNEMYGLFRNETWNT